MTAPTKRAIGAVYRKFVGRKIVEVRPNFFHTDNAGTNARNGWTSDPVFVFDDGSTAAFVVDETETGEYGLTPIATPKKTKGEGG